MQGGSITDAVPALDTGRDRNLVQALLTASAEALGFWTSVVLPAVYLPLFVLRGVDAVTVAGFLLAHALAVVVGHSYGR
ncbi:hypothetical protein [Halorarius halobius]|uniref:hypothetical protein n=1 Tax=Halorarius halobius TaxID=2962671 RepID=UPI0020CDA88A|nr:hypothetical protein [Halorarius halobius]